MSYKWEVVFNNISLYGALNQIMTYDYKSYSNVLKTQLLDFIVEIQN